MANTPMIQKAVVSTKAIHSHQSGQSSIFDSFQLFGAGVAEVFLSDSHFKFQSFNGRFQLSGLASQREAREHHGEVAYLS